MKVIFKRVTDINGRSIDAFYPVYGDVTVYLVIYNYNNFYNYKKIVSVETLLSGNLDIYPDELGTILNHTEIEKIYSYYFNPDQIINDSDIENHKDICDFLISLKRNDIITKILDK